MILNDLFPPRRQCSWFARAQLGIEKISYLQSSLNLNLSNIIIIIFKKLNLNWVLLELELELESKLDVLEVPEKEVAMERKNVTNKMKILTE